MPSDPAPSLGRSFSRRRDHAPDPDLARERADEQLQQQDRQQQAFEQQRHRLLGRTQPSEEAHAALTSSLHGVFGNSVIQGALAGRETGPGQVIEGAMTLGAAGVAVADDTVGLFNNSAVQGWMAQSLGMGAEGAGLPGAGLEGAEGAGLDAPVVARLAQGEVFEQDAGRKVGTALGRGGRSLPTELSARLGAAFGGVDFSGVRIHTDGAAAQASQAINAHAFTVGTDIYFNDGSFNTASSDGQHLLAHELTHVVQHLEGRLRPGSSGGDGELDVSSPTDPHELEAESRAAQVPRALSDGTADAAVAGLPDPAASMDAPGTALALEERSQGGALDGADDGAAGLSPECPAIVHKPAGGGAGGGAAGGGGQ